MSETQVCVRMIEQLARLREFRQATQRVAALNGMLSNQTADLHRCMIALQLPVSLLPSQPPHENKPVVPEHEDAEMDRVC